MGVATTECMTHSSSTLWPNENAWPYASPTRRDKPATQAILQKDMPLVHLGLSIIGRPSELGQKLYLVYDIQFDFEGPGRLQYTCTNLNYYIPTVYS